MFPRAANSCFPAHCIGRLLFAVRGPMGRCRGCNSVWGRQEENRHQEVGNRDGLDTKQLFEASKFLERGIVGVFQD